MAYILCSLMWSNSPANMSLLRPSCPFVHTMFFSIDRILFFIRFTAICFFPAFFVLLA